MWDCSRRFSPSAAQPKLSDAERDEDRAAPGIACGPEAAQPNASGSDAFLPATYALSASATPGSIAGAW